MLSTTSTIKSRGRLEIILNVERKTLTIMFAFASVFSLSFTIFIFHPAPTFKDASLFANLGTTAKRKIISGKSILMPSPTQPNVRRSILVVLSSPSRTAVLQAIKSRLTNSQHSIHTKYFVRTTALDVPPESPFLLR